MNPWEEDNLSTKDNKKCPSASVVQRYTFNLTSEKKTTSLQRTIENAPMHLLSRGSTVHMYRASEE